MREMRLLCVCFLSRSLRLLWFLSFDTVGPRVGFPRRHTKQLSSEKQHRFGRLYMPKKNGKKMHDFSVRSSN